MTKKSKTLLAILLIVAIAVGTTIISASGPAPEPYVDSWEIVQAMSEEEVIALVEKVLTCKSGELPDHCFAACVRAQEIDPELANAAFDHIGKISVPAVAPEEKKESSRNSGPDCFGAYVRNGNGGYYEYDEYENSSTKESKTADKANDGEISPQSYTDYDSITTPSTNRKTSSICKIYAKRKGVPQTGTGFFVGNKYIATAAHVIYNNQWDDILLNAGWADEVYIIQAYAPTQSNDRPYGVAYANNKNMRVGASWEGKFGYDADWGVFELQGSLKGTYSYLPKKQISVKTYHNIPITAYGYPGLYDTQSLLYVNGKTTSKTDYYETYRVLYNTDPRGGPADGFKGMSGGPVLDSTGNVIGIFTGQTKDIEPKLSMAVSLDVDLYNALKKYE